MRKLVLFLSFAMVLTFLIPVATDAQTADSEQFDPEEYFARYGSVTSELPTFYATRSALESNEMHLLDTLTRDERQIIEESFDPPAIGVIRDLNEPVYFNLHEITVPESGEISQFGGRISRVSKELLVYTTFVQTKKADEIRLFFAEGNFPHGVKVNLFSKDDYAFNQHDLRGTLDGYGFYTTTTFADYITLQVVIPILQIEENVYFKITKVIHADNRYIPEETYRDCFLDANCGDANSFAHIDGFRRATARLSFPVLNKYGLCTGTQLNDARAGDWQPFLLTANHCFDTQTSAAGLEARFYYWSTSCNSGVVNPSHIIINGANLIATNTQTDFTLVLLKEVGGNYYMGWDAGSVSNNTVMHSVHHPGGTLMKYHRMLNKTSPNFTCPHAPAEFHYTKVTMGQSEGGSSGSGVVDPEGRIRGQLFGACHLDDWDNCDYDTYYNSWGKFGLSYSNNNLQYWLNNGGSSVAISTSPGSSYNYGTENVGSYDNHVFTINNSGSRPNYLNLETYNAYVNGTDASQFSVIGASSQYLAPGESGTFTVRFSPTSSGFKTAVLNIPHNADNYGSPKQITLTGYGNPCSDIISLSGGGSQNTKTFSKSGTGAWESDFCGFTCNGNEQVYSFVAPKTGTYSITVTSTNSTWVDYFWKTGSCSSGSWTCINDIYSPSTQGLMSWTAGTTYYILLDAEGVAAATHSFYVALNPCSNIISIAGTGSGNAKTYTGGGYGSWYTSSSSACGYYCEGQEQIYSFMAPQTGNYAIQVTAGGSYVDYMWKTGSCSAEDWQCIDDVYTPGLYGEFYWTAGQTYLLLLDDEDNTLSNHTFHIELTEGLGIWTGAMSTNWKIPGNWSFNTVPTSDIDVSIPAETPYQPSILNAEANCNNLSISDGATLTFGGRSLTANGNVNVEGSVFLNQEDAVLAVLGDIHWYDGSFLDVNDYNTFINVYGIWQTDEGSEIAPSAGFVDFKGATDGYIRNYEESSRFYNLRIYKTGGAYLGLSSYCTDPVVIENLLFVTSGAVFNSYTSQNLILRGSFNYYGTFDFTLNNNTGTFIFDGSNQGFNNYGVGSGLFNNVLFSSTTATTANNNIQVAKNISINQGAFNAGAYTITLGGDWNNSVGTSGFNEGTSRVIFDGSSHQNINSDETFNILEANLTAAIRPHDNTVICNVYDWTSGGIDVFDGVFTALDLAENGLFGSFYVNPGGVINLTNDSWVDLNGEIHNFGGTINISGTVSDWPYTNDALIEMTSGVIDFKTCGISMRDNAHTLTTNISGGTIRTAYNFSNERTDVSLSNLTVEMYDPNDATLFLAEGKPIRNLNINKVASDGMPHSQQENRDGSLPTDNSRANNVNLISDIIVNYDVNINGGLLSLNGYETTVNHYFTVYDGGTIVMDNPADVITMSAYLNYFEVLEEGTAILSEGNIYTQGWIIPREGSSFTASTSNTISFKGNTGGGPSCYESSAVYGNIVINKNPGQTTYIDNSATEPVVVDGNVAINADNIFELQNNTLNVHGTATDNATSSIVVYNVSKNLAESSSAPIPEQQSDNETRAGTLEIDTDFTLNGLLDIADGNVAVHGRFTMAATGSMIIDGGTFIADSPSHAKGWEYFRGDLHISDGLFEITHNSINFASTARSWISGGIVRTGGAFYATTTLAFEPTGGTVEIIGNTSDGAIYCSNGNYFYNLLINKNPALWSSFMGSDGVSILNDFTILSGHLNTGECDMFVGGNWANFVGPNAFNENENVVWFYGETYSHILTDETFYDLYIFDMLTDEKPGDGSRFVDETYIDENVTVNVSNNCSILGGSLNFGSNSTLDVQNNLSITSGAEMIVPAMTFAEIFLGGNYDDYNVSPGFYPGHSTFTFDGTANQELNTNNAITNFYNLIINNGSEHVLIGSDLEVFGDLLVQDGSFLDDGNLSSHYFHGDVSIQSNGTFNPHRTVNFVGNSNSVFQDDATGSSYFDHNVYVEKGSPGASLTLESEMLLLGGASLFVEKGILDLNTNLLRCTGSVSIDNDATLIVDEGATLEIGQDDHLNVESGGTLKVLGTSGNPAKVSAWNAPNYYTLNVKSGGNIHAAHAIFEYLKGYRGVFVQDGAFIDPVHCFNNCTFRNGDNSAGSALLVINNNQNLTITGAAFPNASMEYNVGKEGNQGQITFTDYAGAFAGESFDYDPYNRVNWNAPVLSVSPTIRNVSAAAGSTTFAITSNLDWTASESIAWFSISPAAGSGNGTLTVNYLQNTALVSRSGQITFAADGVPNVIVTVNQAGVSASLSVTPANRNVAPAPGTTTFAVSSNTSWTVSESVAWFNVSPMSGSGNKTLVVSYGENGTGSSRIGTIIVTATGGAPSQTVTITQSSYPVQLVALPEGWSGLSGYIMPANNDIEDVFAPVLSDFVIATTMNGIYYPAEPVNTIIDWESQSAYKIKMSAAASLPLIGNAETNKTFSLNSGWSLVPVICNTSVIAQSLFAGQDYEIVKDVAGMGILWPEYGINTLGNFIPGKAYFALMNSAGSITFPANVKDAGDFEIVKAEIPANPWNVILSGPSTHVIAISKNMTGVLEGDLLGVLDVAGNCYGISEINSLSKNMAISVYADDPFTDARDGFAEGSALQLKVFRPTSSEVFDVEAVYDLQKPHTKYFASEGISAITQLKVSALGINESSAASIHLYPNPTNGWVELSGVKDFDKIEFYNASGKLLRTITIENQDKYKLDLSDLPGGVYQLKFTGDSAVAVKKLIRN